MWYEVFDLHVNLSPEKIAETLVINKDVQMILAMHPHGIVPYQAILWAAYCDQYFRAEDGSALYGFGAAADAVGYVPFLRNIMGFLTAGSASYKPLKDGLTKVSFWRHLRTPPTEDLSVVAAQSTRSRQPVREELIHPSRRYRRDLSQ